MPNGPSTIVPISAEPIIRCRSALFWIALAFSNGTSSRGAPMPASSATSLMITDPARPSGGRLALLDDGDHLAPARHLVVGARWDHGPEDLRLAPIVVGLRSGVLEEQRIGIFATPVGVVVRNLVELRADLLHADLRVSEVHEDQRNH